jgi:tetratricopeptide (TPR) repeat protein/tRNA A-37 threonylcarbamoyl transferase component Bud32
MPTRLVPERSPHPYYEILEQCGQGGMGVVYKARDKRLNRIVALKFLLTGGERSEDAPARFRRETLSIAALNHPNISTLYEAGEWDGEPFLAMEFLSGGALSGQKRQGGATYGELIRYASELGSGLQYAHRAGILHRDIKPGNAMFSEHGVLKLVDFGLAKSGAEECLTRTGASVGTIAYMAPELLRGEAASAASDIYAFGLTLYETATGRAAFSARNAGELVAQVMNAGPEPLATLRPDLPASFTEAVNKALAPVAGDRFATMGALLDAIGAAGEEGSVTRTVTMVPAAGSANISGNRNRRRMVVGACGLLAFIGPGAGYWFWNGPGAPRPVAEKLLVVLPFENLGAEPANQPLCDGLQETVTGLLSMAGGTRRVVLVPSSEVRRGQVRTIADARKQFKADLTLTGSAQRTGDRLQLTLNLADAATLRQIDSRIITVALSESATLQDKLAEELGALVGAGPPQPGDGQRESSKTRNSLAYALYLQGVGALEKRNVDLSVDYLRKALEADPMFTPARAKLAEAYLWENNVTSDPKWLAMADAEVTRAAQRGSGREVKMAQAMIRKATGDTEAAIRLFRQLLRQEPGNMEAWQLLSQALVSAKRPDEAEKTLREAIGQRPGYWPLHNTLGVLCMDRQEYEKAEQAFASAAALAPEVAVIASNRGALYFRMSRWPEAALSFEKSLAIAPSALAHANLGAVRFFQGRYEEAAKEAEASTKLLPANPLNWGNLGDALWQLPQKRAAAKEAFGKAVALAGEQLAINPGNVRLRKSYALFLAKSGLRGEAEKQILIAMSQAPKDMNVYFYAARVYAVLGETAAASAALGKCLALGYSADEIAREPDLETLSKPVRQKRRMD